MREVLKLHVCSAGKRCLWPNWLAAHHIGDRWEMCLAKQDGHQHVHTRKSSRALLAQTLPFRRGHGHTSAKVKGALPRK
jgi:hypothetical protein